MTRDEALAVIAAEGLKHYVLYADPANKTNSLVLIWADGRFHVYLTDERAQYIEGSARVFDDAPDALDDFIRRLRLWNRVTGIHAPAAA